MNYSELFKKAHEIARETKEIVGDYRIAFSCALKDLYKEIREANDETVEQKLESLGIEAWEKGDMKRYYINENNFESVFGLTIYRYNSGNICGAHLNGEKISNSHAGRLIGGKKFYFDAISKKWFERYGMNAPKELCDELAACIRV